MILIIGAGDVGSNIALDLAEDQDVAVIDRDADRIDDLTSRLDVSGTVGDGRSVSVLQEAGIDRAEIVVASTDSDAANVMVCNAAKHAGDPHTIARVKDVGLYRTWQSLEGGLSVDRMLCIDVLAAEAVVQTVALSGAEAVETFADGRVEVAEFVIDEDTPVTGQSIAETDHYPSATFVAILRDDDILTPEGDTVMQSGDRLIVIGSLHGVRQFAEDISSQPSLDADSDIVIVGGDVLGYQIAQQFEARGWIPQVVERDPNQAVGLTTQLRGLSSSEVDTSDVGRFEPDFLTNADLVVGAVDDDTNYLLTQLAREQAVGQTATVVDDPAVVGLFEETGLDVVVHPEDIIAGKILQVIYGSRPENIGVFEHDNAEVLEVVIDEGSTLAGKPLKNAVSELPAGVVIGAIIRNGQLQTPRESRIIQTGDRVIAFVNAEVASEAAELM
ncbi:Trk system potassium transporter TrkA [Natrinema caseinilyticum]|uniref:Trk system potassium transporter TrkA n=1 Tax=Natrinema caseinilyticum TaxID=2961570 RepID=UPI0020C58871|nr:Trk system potassium transporter TrkA [Natrinema caseinilyticum]